MKELGGWTCPDGWTIEAPPYLRGCVVINHPDGGSITVDFDNRIFGLGHAIPHTWRESMTFNGGNWRFRLMTAAADYLSSVMELKQ